MTMQSDDAYEIQMRKTDAAEAEVERLRADNEWLRGVMANAIAAQDWEIARRALAHEQNVSGEVKR